jgi:hypothetical protein
VDFVTTCSNELEKIGSGEVYKRYGKTYFSLEQIKFLPSLIRENAAFTDLVITPYYFFDEQVMELYDYTLSIRIVESLHSREQFLLEETGKKSIEEIDSKIIEKLDNTYYEVVEGDAQSFLKSLKQYINFMNVNEANLLAATRYELGTHNEQDDGIYYELI